MSKHGSSSVFAIWISLISNLALTLIKVLIGFIFKSPVLIADGVHNAGDVLASFAALIASLVARKPADESHPYGHGKANIIGSAAISIIMGLAAIYITYHSIKSFYAPPGRASLIALTAAFVSFIWKLLLYLYCNKLGKASRNKSLIATANDHLADVYSSIAAVIGIGAAITGEMLHINILAYGDPAAGIVVSVFVLKLASDMGREAVDILMESAVTQDKLEAYNALVESVPEVKRIDRIRAREHGHYVIIDVRVSIPAELSIQQGHDVSRRIKQAIMGKHPDVEEVLIHMNPWHNDNVEATK